MAEGLGKPENLPNRGQDPCEEEDPLGMKSGDPWVFCPGIFLWRRHALLLEDKGRA